MNKPIASVTADEPMVSTHVCEFHCMMARRSLLDLPMPSAPSPRHWWQRPPRRIDDSTPPAIEGSPE